VRHVGAQQHHLHHSDQEHNGVLTQSDILARCRTTQHKNRK
jgi:hypothetical protein